MAQEDYEQAALGSKTATTINPEGRSRDGGSVERRDQLIAGIAKGTSLTSSALE